MRVVLSHRTAAFALLNPAIRDTVLASPRVTLPAGFSTELNSYDAARLASRLGIDERICCGIAKGMRRRHCRGYFTRFLNLEEGKQSFIHLGRDIYIPCPELVFLQMAAELPFASLVRFGYDLCGTYIPGHGEAKTSYWERPLTTVAHLGSFVAARRGQPFANLAGAALKHVIDKSASPAESILAILFVLPHRKGGYGAPHPQMNALFDKAPTERFPDLYWDEFKIDLEYDSDEFHDNATRDAIRRNGLVAAIRPLTATWNILKDLQLLDDLARDFYAVAGKRLRIQCVSYEELHRALHVELLEPEWYLQAPQGSYRIS